MAHMFGMMYGVFGLEGITIDDLIRIVFSCALDKRILDLENRERGEKSCRACAENALQSEQKCSQNRYMKYADLAIRDIDSDILWLVIEEACCVLAIPSPSQHHRLYFDNLFGRCSMRSYYIYPSLSDKESLYIITFCSSSSGCGCSVVDESNDRGQNDKTQTMRLL